MICLKSGSMLYLYCTKLEVFKVENRYCKLKGSNKIYLIEKQIGDEVILVSENIRVRTNMNKLSS